MGSEEFNCYQDDRRAESYARLEFPGTYYLAYRDIPKIIAEHATGKAGLDFGCGTGRSTRFFRKCGFDVIGADIAANMLEKAREIDPDGDYRLIGDGDLGIFKDSAFDLILSVFTFDNIPGMDRKVAIFKELKRLLTVNGHIVSLVSSPEIYKHEWASFSTKDFPENKNTRSGDLVKIIMTDVADRRPVEDIIWYDESYYEVYKAAGLEVVQSYRPLAREDEPFAWVNETKIAPWVIYVLRPSA